MSIEVKRENEDVTIRLESRGIHAWGILAGVLLLGVVIGAALPKRQPAAPLLPEAIAKSGPETIQAIEDCTALRLSIHRDETPETAKRQLIQCSREALAGNPGPKAKRLAREARMELIPPAKSEEAKAVQELAEQLKARTLTEQPMRDGSRRIRPLP